MTIAERNEMVEANRGLVGRVVNHYMAQAPPHIERDDLMQAGLIGLIEGIDRFDPTRGTKLSTYVVHRIRHEVVAEARTAVSMPSKSSISHEVERPAMHPIEDAHDVADPAPDMVELAAEGNTRDVVLAALADKPQYQAIIDLHYFQGRCIEGIAADMGLTRQRVNDAKNVALKRLRGPLARHFDLPMGLGLPVDDGGGAHAIPSAA